MADLTQAAQCPVPPAPDREKAARWKTATAAASVKTAWTAAAATARDAPRNTASTAKHGGTTGQSGGEPQWHTRGRDWTRVQQRRVVHAPRRASALGPREDKTPESRPENWQRGEDGAARDWRKDPARQGHAAAAWTGTHWKQQCWHGDGTAVPPPPPPAPPRSWGQIAETQAQLTPCAKEWAPHTTPASWRGPPKHARYEQKTWRRRYQPPQWSMGKSWM